jgi:hypothetical protein
MRSSATLSVLLLALVLVAGCYHNTVKSNGPAFAFTGSTTATQGPTTESVAPTSAITFTPAEPGTLDPVTLSFQLFNYTGSNLPALYYQVSLDAIEGPVVANGTVPAFGPYAFSAILSNVVAAPAGGGTHTFYIYVDPANILNQRSVASNIAAVTVSFADFNLSFSALPSVTTVDPTTATPLTISFAVFNDDTSGNLSTAIGVEYQVLEFGLAVASGTIPNIPANTSVGVAALIPPPVAGLHEYTVVINPGKLIPEQDYDQNKFSVAATIAVAN